MSKLSLSDLRGDTKPVKDTFEGERDTSHQKANGCVLTSIFITKYEVAAILGARARAISQNAPIMVDPKGEVDPLRIARMELQKKRLPLLIKRKLPGGGFEVINPNELLV